MGSNDAAARYPLVLARADQVSVSRRKRVKAQTERANHLEHGAEFGIALGR